MTFREAYAFGENELHMAGIDDAGVDAWYLLEYVTGIIIKFLPPYKLYKTCKNFFC